MRTQINQLRSGLKNQVLNSNVDYTQLPKSSNHENHAGTNHILVREVWEKVKSENPTFLDIEIRGIRLRLKAHWSTSKLSCSYSTDITPEQLYELVYLVSAKNKTPRLVIHDSNTIEVNNGKNSFRYLCPSFVTILENEIEEYCPYCDTDVILQNVFVAQVCPECNKWIMPCSICEHRMPETGSQENCSNCDYRLDSIKFE